MYSRENITCCKSYAKMVNIHDISSCPEKYVPLNISFEDFQYDVPIYMGIDKNIV